MLLTEMRRLRTSRLMQLVITMVWCGVIAARPIALPCPVGGHGAHSTSSGHAVSGHAEEMVGHEMAGHDMAGHEMSGHQMPAAPDSPTPAHQCDCLGHCCSTAAALPAPAPGLVTVAEAHRSPPPSEPHARPTPAWRDFVLPFAIAPPVSAHS